MKSLSLAKPLAIMMIGLPGAGKSQFAKQFSDMFSAPVCSLNRLRYELFNSPSFQPQEYEILKRVVCYQIEELSKTGKSFIIDGACNALAERRDLAGIVRKNGYDTLVVWVQTDEPTARLRSVKRGRNDHLAEHQTMNLPAFESELKRLNPPAAAENYVVISGKHTFSTQARAVLKKLAAPRAETVQNHSVVRNQDIHAHAAPAHLKPPARRVQIT
ncbi:MAG: ATP-binding protein [Candidatus Chaera renei]|uniref:ATP-binding protein n=1 Tax=Candidatus Chaera renei TaxID=2506947 RepID=A0A4Q0AIW9_9BACT|nr:MAG: ATP-binding protein [Candidatus Chaera renei]